MALVCAVFVCTSGFNAVLLLGPAWPVAGKLHSTRMSNSWFVHDMLCDTVVVDRALDVL